MRNNYTQKSTRPSQNAEFTRWTISKSFSSSSIVHSVSYPPAPSWARTFLQVLSGEKTAVLRRDVPPLPKARRGLFSSWSCKTPPHWSRHRLFTSMNNYSIYKLRKMRQYTGWSSSFILSYKWVTLLVLNSSMHALSSSSRWWQESSMQKNTIPIGFVNHLLQLFICHVLAQLLSNSL